MRSLHRTLALALAAMMLLSSVPAGNACGPEYTIPIFVFKSSPDLPFGEFISGKIGIVRPSFGRKTLAIAYRFLNGGSFTSDVQDDLIAALKGAEPEDEGDSAVEAWIDARKEIVGEEQPLPELYTERERGGYNFFPNCTKNAFEVALETLKNRAATYGAQDQNVLAWLAAQDTVFNNCSRGSHVPAELGAESPTWLRKDRDYQIAASYFYSLAFDEARKRFEKIASDYESPWQQIAPYLAARTLVRQASLEENDPKKRELYELAESRLQTLSAGGGGKFTKASVRLLGLVRYNLRPEERAVELGRVLASGNDENVQQDLIDYVWLLDKFEARILKAEEERRKKLNPTKEDEAAPSVTEARATYDRVQRGEVLEINYYPKEPDGRLLYERRVHLVVAHDTPETEILRSIEKVFQRPLTPEETQEVKDLHKSALDRRARLLTPNSRWVRQDEARYQGEYWSDSKITLDLVPEFLRADDLSDWIFTLQTNDPYAYRQAFSKWRQTGSHAWLATSLIKAETSSPRLREIMSAAEKIARTDSAYPTVAYHMIRLKMGLGHRSEARKLVDEVMSQTAILPLSAQNQFLEKRMQLAGGLDEFLRSAQRKPVAFYKYGMIASLRKLYEVEKEFWSPEYMSRTKEEIDKDLENEYKDLLPWDDRLTFDEPTTDILNWHFSLERLIAAARNPNVPEYLKRTLILAAWTRAILLNEDKVALEIAPEVVKLAPEMSSVLGSYIKSTAGKERQRAALYVLLKTPGLRPYIPSSFPNVSTSEPMEYYLAQGWWCPLEETEYTDDGKTVPKLVPKPTFLTAAELETARRERRAMIDLGDAKSYLGKQVLEWASSSPDDPRLPEALFIAVKANHQYKYGCDGWAHDEETMNRAESILRERYPLSPWTAKLTVPRE